MNYIVGLGNFGEKYKDTRHNVGFFMLEHIISEFGWLEAEKNSSYNGLYTEGRFTDKQIRCLFPTTFMNNSGEAVKKLVPREEIEKLVVIYDDIDLPVGEIKVSFGRGDGGHNGIKSIINSLSSKDFVRVRVGIASIGFWTGKPKRPSGSALPAFVLKKFSKNEKIKIDEAKEKVFEVIKVILESGVESAMNKFN